MNEVYHEYNSIYVFKTLAGWKYLPCCEEWDWQIEPRQSPYLSLSLELFKLMAWVAINNTAKTLQLNIIRSSSRLSILIKSPLKFLSASQTVEIRSLCQSDWFGLDDIGAYGNVCVTRHQSPTPEKFKLGLSDVVVGREALLGQRTKTASDSTRCFGVVVALCEMFWDKSRNPLRKRAVRQLWRTRHALESNGAWPPPSFPTHKLPGKDTANIITGHRLSGHRTD